MNGTHVLIILGGFVDVEKYRYIYFVFFLTVYILIISCNCTIIWLIWIHRNLHEPMYIFIAALSLNSLFYSTAFYPKLIVDVLSHQQSISHAACMFQMFCFYTLAASDFFLLAAMGYDRYVSICKPLQYATIMSATNVAILLAFAWLLPGIKVGLAVYFNTKIKMCKFVSGGIFCNNSVNKLQCMKPQILTIYTVFVFINCEILPVLFILYTYIKIFIISYRRCGRAWKKAAETCLPHLMVLICFSCLVMFDVVVDKLESDLPKTTRLIMMLQIVMYNPLFNPIIYGLKMKQIWRHIKMLFGSRSKSNPARPAR